MFEKKKLEEVEYFYGRMVEENENPAAFEHNLSALLTAGRTVLQYAIKQAKNRPGGEKWYSSWMANKVLRFFSDMRNENIHEKPVQPLIGIALRPEPITYRPSFGSGTPIVQSINGYLVNSKLDSLIHVRDPLARTVAVHQYGFTNWDGWEDVISLSSWYMHTLKDVVNDGIAQGFLTG